MEIRKITLNELFLIEPIFNTCFCCGSKEYKEIYIKNHLFRLCKTCEKREDVISHFRKLIKGLRSYRFGDGIKFGRICDECLKTKHNPCPVKKISEIKDE